MTTITVPPLRFVTEDWKTGHQTTRPLTPPTSRKRAALFTGAGEPQPHKRPKAKETQEAFPCSLQAWYFLLSAREKDLKAFHVIRLSPRRRET